MIRPQSFEVGPLGPYEVTGNKSRPIRFLSDEEAERRYEEEMLWNYRELHKAFEERDPLHSLRMLPWGVQLHLLELEGLNPEIRTALEESCPFYRKPEKSETKKN